MKKAFCLLSIIIFQYGNAQNVYFKTVDVPSVRDSILKELKSSYQQIIHYSQSSYWNSRSDTSPKMDLYNSEIFISRIDSTTSSLYVVNPYFIFGPIKRHSPSMVYFDFNSDSLFTNKIRPDVRDISTNFDTSSEEIVIFTTYQYSHYSPGTDGSYLRIGIFSNEKEKYFAIDQTLFNSDKFYFRYNSKLEIYLLQLLLKQELNDLIFLIDYEVEMAKSGRLSEKEELEFYIKQLPERKAKLKEWEEYLYIELEKIEKSEH